MRKNVLCLLLCGLTALTTTVKAQNKEEYQSVTKEQINSEDDWKFRFGGYGEMLARRMDYGLNRWGTGTATGNKKIDHNDISIPRFVLALDYKFNKKWILGAEIEFESGGTGSAYELEAGTGSENGEYEQEFEKGGEVALEQFHITRLIIPEFNVRVGHMILPVGLTNTHHEPINFFGTSRPEGETKIIPSTWHETGIEFYGTIGKGYGTFDYEAMIVSGPNPNGFSKYDWIKGGRQGFFESDNFTSPAYILRLDYKGIPNLRVGGSFYFSANAAKNADKLTTYDQLGKIPVKLWNFDAQYSNKYLTARANYIRGHVAHAAGITSVNNSYSKLSPYGRKAPFASEAATYSAEVGVNLNAVFNNSRFPSIIPFAHYEYYNPQEKGDVGQTMDARCQVSMWRVGFNWKPLPNLVVKADYTTRQIGTQKIFGTGKYNSENEFAIGIAYAGWFFQK
ncbi:MAG: hypothetical protein J6T82_03520 [Bacteroidaceae bacterium]|nr:hypothetical protein [Bacteroidaceae bacterium]